MGFFSLITKSPAARARVDCPVSKVTKVTGRPARTSSIAFAVAASRRPSARQSLSMASINMRRDQLAEFTASCSVSLAGALDFATEDMAGRRKIKVREAAHAS